jgi:Uncharacterised protein conserved in bacteria (DUF2336)
VKTSIDVAVEQSAQRVEAVVASRRDYGKAFGIVHALTEERPLKESDLLDFASGGKLEETVCAMAYVIGLSVSATERMFDGSEADLLLVIGKSQGWSWRTLRALLSLRNPAPAAHELRKAQGTYDQLSTATAQRVVQFLKAREAAERRSAEEAAVRRQIRRRS